MRVKSYSAALTYADAYDCSASISAAGSPRSMLQNSTAGCSGSSVLDDETVASLQPRGGTHGSDWTSDASSQRSQRSAGDALCPAGSLASSTADAAETVFPHASVHVEGRPCLLAGCLDAG